MTTKNEIYILPSISAYADKGSDMLLCKINYINDMNSEKYFSCRDLLTTETIENVDLPILFELAHKMKVEVRMPQKDIGASHVYLEFPWGGMVLMGKIYMS